jgi:uncharacterized phage protein gp47/JayE
MSLPTPTTAALAANIQNQIGATLAQTVPILPRAFINVLAKVLAAVTVILWKYCGFIFLQLFVAYASAELTTVNGKQFRPLVEWGRLIGVGDPLPAVPAQLQINVTVTAQVGSLAANTYLLFPPTGVIYRTVAPVPLNAPTVPVTILAVSTQKGGDGSGAIGNLQPGDVVEFSNTPLNMLAKAPVVAQLATGTEAEDIELYRARIISRFQSKPQGGAPDNYRTWAGVPGILAVYPYRGFPGEVDVYVEATVASSGNPDGIPAQAQLDAVLDAIEKVDPVTGLATRRPVNAAVNVLPIKRTGFDLVVVALDTPNRATTQGLIAAGVDEHLRSLEPFIKGLSGDSRKDRVAQFSVAAVVDGVVAAAGGTVASVVLLENGTPLTARNLAAGEKAKLAGTPTYS